MPLKLNENDLKEAKKAITTLKKTNLEQESIFDVFTNWQSLKLRSVKRFLLTTSVIITFAYIANINVTTLKILPAKVPDESQPTIFILLFFLILISTLYYRYLNNHDWHIRKAKVMSLEDSLKSCIEASNTLKKISSEYENITSVKHLMNVAYSPSTAPALKSFNSINFYQTQIEDKEKTYFKIQKLEGFLLHVLIFITLIFLVLSYFDINFNMILSLI